MTGTDPGSGGSGSGDSGAGDPGPGDPVAGDAGTGESGPGGGGTDGGGPIAAGLGALGGVAWAVYLPGLAVLFRGAPPGRAPYPAGSEVYAQLLALPLALVLVGVPAVRRLPGADARWGRRGTGLVTVGATLLAFGILAVTFLSVPGRSPAPLSAVVSAGLSTLQFGATALGYALWTGPDDPTPAGMDPPPSAGDGVPVDEFANQHRVAAGLLLLSVPGLVVGVAGTRLLFSAVPFYVGVAVPVGLGWAGACYAVLIATRGGEG